MLLPRFTQHVPARHVFRGLSTITASPRIITICIVCICLSALITLSWRASPDSYGALLANSRPSPNSPKFAFATFIAGNKDAEGKEDNEDGYFVSARVLVYQLSHSTTARSNSSIPVIVLVTDDVSESKRSRLREDGAIILQADKLGADWVVPGAERWRDMLTKLRLFQETQYSKICFIDADTLVTKPLDGVFLDKATDIRTTGDNHNATKSDESPLPPQYMFAGKPDSFGYDHPYPPKETDYFNGGFFVFAPGTALFNYYLSILKIPGRFDSGFMEQNLLNYAHRLDGNMPWQRLWHGWNMNWPTSRDLDGGVHSFHSKFWTDDSTHDPKLKLIWRSQRAEMEGFYRGREEQSEGRKHGWFSS